MDWPHICGRPVDLPDGERCHTTAVLQTTVSRQEAITSHRPFSVLSKGMFFCPMKVTTPTHCLDAQIATLKQPYDECYNSDYLLFCHVFLTYITLLYLPEIICNLRNIVWRKYIQLRVSGSL